MFNHTFFVKALGSVSQKIGTHFHVPRDSHSALFDIDWTMRDHVYRKLHSHQHRGDHLVVTVLQFRFVPIDSVGIAV